MSNDVHLESNRLIVRDWRADEVDGMHRWYGDPTVRKFLSFGADSREESEKHLKETVIPSQRQSPRIEYYLAVELKETGQTIGDVGFEWKGPGLVEIGYFLELDYWGAGYATEAARLLTSIYGPDDAAKILVQLDDDRVRELIGAIHTILPEEARQYVLALQDLRATQAPE